MNGGDLSNSIGGFNNNNMDQNQVQQMMQMISNGMPMNPMMSEFDEHTFTRMMLI